MRFMPAVGFVAALMPGALLTAMSGQVPKYDLRPAECGRGAFLTPRQARRRAIRNEMAAMSRARNRKR